MAFTIYVRVAARGDLRRASSRVRSCAEIAVGDAQIEALALDGGLTHAALVDKTAAQLLELYAACLIGQFGLAHAVAGARAEVVEAFFVLYFSLEAVHGHFFHLYLHFEIGELGGVGEFLLLDGVDEFLSRVAQFAYFGFGGLEVETQQRRAGFDLVAGAAVDFDHARCYGRCDDFLECRHYFARGLDGAFDGAAVDGAHVEFAAPDAAACHRHDDCDAGDDHGSGSAKV